MGTLQTIMKSSFRWFCAILFISANNFVLIFYHLLYYEIFRHNDFPLTIRKIYKNDLTNLDFDSNLTQNPLFEDYAMCHTDLPKLRKGKVGGQVSNKFM